MNNGTLNQAAQNFLNAAASLSREVSKTATPEYLTIKEACAIAKVTRWTIYRWLRIEDANGEYVICWCKHGTGNRGPVRIHKASFIAFLESKVQHANMGKEV